MRIKWNIKAYRIRREMKIVMFQPLITRRNDEEKKWNEKTFQIYLQHISVYDDAAVWRRSELVSSHISLSTSLPLEMDEAKVI